MKRAVAIGFLTAILLTSIRGGSLDSVWVPLLFGLGGFVGTLLISYSVRHDPTNKLEQLNGQDIVATWSRNFVAIAIAASMVIWSGPLAFSAMYSGWLVALFLTLAGSLVVCSIAAQWPTAFGILVATAISISVAIQNARWERASGNPRSWEEFLKGEYKVLLMIWLVLAGLSLVVSVPIQLNRSRSRQ